MVGAAIWIIGFCVVAWFVLMVGGTILGMGMSAAENMSDKNKESIKNFFGLLFLVLLLAYFRIVFFG